MNWLDVPAFVLLFGVSVVLGYVAHEFGHALLAVAVGLKLRRIWIGGGRALIDFRVGATHFRLGAALTSGLVVTYPLIPRRKAPLLAFIAGGPLANLAAILGMVVAFAPALTADLGRADFALVILVYGQAVLLFHGLLPRTPVVFGQKRMSDGRLFMAVLKEQEPHARASFTAAAFRQAVASYEGAVAEPFIWSDASSRLLALHSDAVRLAGRYDDDFILDCERELARPHSAAERLLLLDSLVTHTLYAGVHARDAKLDEWSKRALAIRPDLPTLKGSRGAVLLHLGRPAEGKALLGQAEYGDPFNTMLNRAFLAKADFALGDGGAARHEFATAMAAAATQPRLRSGMHWDLIRRLADEMGFALPSFDAAAAPVAASA